MEYHVEAQATLPLGVEKDEVHYADCYVGMTPFASALFALVCSFEVCIPVNMFVYNFSTSSSLMSGSRALSTTAPSESINL